jgi:hypothetical protein
MSRHGGRSGGEKGERKGGHVPNQESFEVISQHETREHLSELAALIEAAQKLARKLDVEGDLTVEAFGQLVDARRALAVAGELIGKACAVEAPSVDQFSASYARFADGSEA